MNTLHDAIYQLLYWFAHSIVNQTESNDSLFQLWQKIDSLPIWSLNRRTLTYNAIYWITYFFGFLLPNRVKATWAARWFILSQTIDANESIKLSKTLGRINRLRIAIAKRIAPFAKIKIFGIALLSLTDLHLSALTILAILAVLAIVVGLVVSVTSYRNTSNYSTRRNDRGYRWTDSYDD